MKLFVLLVVSTMAFNIGKKIRSQASYYRWLNKERQQDDENDNMFNDSDVGSEGDDDVSVNRPIWGYSDTCNLQAVLFFYKNPC